ncbi:MAG: tryptophan synthase subunit alpha [Pelosinus sp.]|nr:tryptophan synthase subunit alpha [Pelosinus sp.]
MTRIGDKFKELASLQKKGLIVYITGGCPDMDTTIKAVLAAEKAGADIIEIGIPFSDPMADGPVIQHAATKALERGATVNGILAALKKIREVSAIPVAFMTYFNPIMQHGVAAFVRDAKAAGADGFIVPDLSLEENGEMLTACKEEQLDLVEFVAPTTTANRFPAICQQASGFVYCISNTGVTGAKVVDYSTLAPITENIKKNTAVPVAIGFGISSPAAAKAASQYAEAVIVGSAVMDKLMNSGVQEMAGFIAELRSGLDGE